jgi:hypothetical protein
LSELTLTRDCSSTTRIRRLWSLWAVSLLLLVALAFYLPLLRRSPPVRPQAYEFFFGVLLFRALTHLLLLLVASIRTGLKFLPSPQTSSLPGATRFQIDISVRLHALSALVFWGVSLVGLLALGGLGISRSFLGLVLIALILMAIGDRIALLIMPQTVRSWALALAFGIALTSILGTVLSAFHFFREWVLGSILLGGLVWALRGRVRSLLRELRLRWTEMCTVWNFSHMLALEGVFLVTVFLIVAAAAPELRSDAIRVYWPYVKLMRHSEGFFDLPFHFSYIIPQAGLSYAASVFLLLGSRAVRWAMLLPWLALVGIVASRFNPGNGDGSNRVPSGVRVAFALVMASCPVLLSLTPSLMQDTFVCLIAVLFATICMWGRNPERLPFWAAVGATAGLAWTSKFTLLAYVAPLAVCAIYRGRRFDTWRTVVRSLALAALAFVVSAGPWLWHSYRQSGNPVFPFFLSVLPAPSWPNGFGKMNLDNFRLSGGVRGWLFSPFDMTYSTSRFAEGTDGYLGLVIPVILIASILIVRRGTARTRMLAICAVSGTALLWTQTAYIRYWLPGIWILALAASPHVDKYGCELGFLSKSWLCLLGLAISLCQIPSAMINSWIDPQGWPWDFFSGKIDTGEYVNRIYPGFDQFRNLEVFQKGWPRVWHTNYEAIGHLKVRPLEAYLWEMSLHGVANWRERIKYLGSAGCEYWVVDKNREGAKWFQVMGLDQFYWDDEYLIASQGSVAVYKMRPAGEVLKTFDARSKVGTDLVADGGFESGRPGLRRQWMSLGAVDLGESNSEAKNGTRYLALGSDSKVYRLVPLPAGVRRLEASVWGRTAAAEKSSRFRLEVSWLDNSEKPLPGTTENARLSPEWQELRFVTEVPKHASMAYLLVSNEGDVDTRIFVDEVHLCPVE